jgi:hypothetical protein
MALALAVGAARTAAAPATAGAFAANVFWTLHNASCLLPMVLAAPAPAARAREGS